MEQPTDLLLDQAERFAALDPLLPALPAPGPGHTLVAAVSGGARVTGVLDSRTAGSRQIWELAPLVGHHGGHGMDVILRAWRAALDHAPVTDDSVATLLWPSRDVECVRPLLDHGLIPALTLGVRLRPAPPSPNPLVTIRRANPEDLDTMLNLERYETAYSAQFAVSVTTAENPAPTRRSELLTLLAHPERLWVAERPSYGQSEIVGMIEREVGDSSRFDHLLLPGSWGQVRRLVVHPDQQGHGIGRALADAAHDSLIQVGIHRSTAWYSPLNPISSVFWHRQGYRPLWTAWQCNPASAMR